MKRLRWHRPRGSVLASGGVIGLSVAGIVAATVLAQPVVTVRQVDLNDGGIWVTSDSDGLFARLNKPAAALDAAFYPPGGAQKAYALDVVQEGAAVAAWDRATGRLLPVDVSRAVTVGDKGLGAPGGFQVEMTGGTLAVLDPQSGQVWADRVDVTRGITSLAAFDQSAPPTASVGVDGTDAKASLAVGVDGTVHAVSLQGKAVTVPVDRGRLGKPAYRQVASGLRSVQATAVGADLVVFDRLAGTALMPSGNAVSLGSVGEDAEPQMPGPAADSVVIATDTALVRVRLGDGQVTTLPAGGSGTPTRPVRLDDCVHAAWAGANGGYRKACADGPIRPGNLRNAEALLRPVFRQNRGGIVLNDLATGAVWDLTTQRRVDDWTSVKPPPIVKNGNKKRDKNNPPVLARDKPPKAVDDSLGARPGRTTLLHVLDNDSDPAGKVLSIAGITAADDPDVRLAIAPDGQSIAISVPQAGSPVHFSYTVDDGTLSAKATVTVEIRTSDQNREPNLRPGFRAPAPTLPAGGHLALPVLADWRDFDGDPVVLAGAEAKGGTATTTPDGFLTYQAPATGGLQRVTYHVTDARSEPKDSAVDVNVQAPTATNGVPASTQPDVARGQVGQPIVIRPLDNDLPGSDPTAPEARLQLAGDVVGRDGASAVTDIKAGTVTVTARRPGSYTLEYTAAFGNAPFAKGTIRVDAVPVPSSPTPPVAMPDYAVVYGQTPATVDVLANDFDPAGNVLVVQRAEVAGAPADLQVAVVGGHWLRINATSAAQTPVPQIVRYTVTDGVTSPVRGEVTVTRLPDPERSVPVPKDDYAIVRAGQTVTVGVLDNDVNAAGAPMTLAANVVGATAGQLPVSSGAQTDPKTVGAAYVTGNVVRYVAPDSVKAALSATVDYVVQNAAGDQAVGHLHLTVTPPPGPATPNQPPTPLNAEARAVAGQTIVIPVPTSAVDPDGDTVAVTGLGSIPALGRIVAVNATSLTYEAYPTAGGTDSFEYRVVDPYGAVGHATIRVAVTPPGTPQPPLAVDDLVTAGPDTKLTLDVLANDVLAAGDAVTIGELAGRNPTLSESASLVTKTGPIQLTAPGLTGKPLVVRYAISDGLAEPSVATVTVRSQKGYNIPPTLYDAFPVPDKDSPSVTVDLAGDRAKKEPALALDTDGTTDDLTVTRVSDTAAAVDGRVIKLPMTAVPHTVFYEVRDAGGATAIGLIHVPVAGTGAPYVKPGSVIRVPVNGKVTAALGDFVVDPAGKPVKLTLKNLITGSPKALAATSTDEEHLVLTASNGYTGPGAVGFEVTDGDSLNDAHGVRVMLTIPVQVGAEKPVLRCPADPLTVVEGGATVAVDVTSVCHVWAADPSTLAGLRYDAAWETKAGDLTVNGSGEHIVSVTAGSAAVPGTSTALLITVHGTDVKARLPIRVVAPAPLAVDPIAVDGLKAGDSRIIDVAAFARSQLRQPVYTVLSATQADGMPGAVSSSGSSVTITPGGESHGTMIFLVRLTDVTDTARTDRQAIARITVHVLGKPDPPGTPVIGRTVLSESVQLSWGVPANNGAPIERYEVQYNGGTQTCAGSPCLITNLHNGDHYRFQVRAVNLVGPGAYSPQSAVATPDEVPTAVTDVVVSNPQDGQVDLAWTPPVFKGTAVQRYEVTWANGGHDSTPVPRLTATGLDNDSRYTFTIVAVNKLGPGPAATAPGQSAGAPPQPPAPSFSSVDAADNQTRTVHLSWPDVDPNGPGPTTYTLVRTGGATVTVCADVTATSCDDDNLANNGVTYTYTLTAKNAAAAQGSPQTHTSPPSPGTTMEAASTPDAITGYSATPTGTDGQATITFDVNQSNGASSTVSCTWGGGTSCGSWTFSTAGQANVTRTVNGLPNGQNVTLSLVDCNGSHGGAGAGSACGPPATANVTTYGPMKNLVISASANGTNVDFTVSVDPNGKPAQVHVQTSKQNQTFTTGVGAWSWSSSDNVGYSSSDTITVTVSDSGRTTLNGSRTQNTGPPPPSVTVSRGARCGGGGGSPCRSNDGSTCSSRTCGYVHVVTSNFPGNVSCTFNSQTGNGGWEAPVAYGPNESRDSGYWYGFPNNWVSVTCNGVTGTFIWPSS